MKAWLITWEWMGDHAAEQEPVIAILRARTSSEQVRRYVEFFYNQREMSLSEKLACAHYNNPTRPVYRAEFFPVGEKAVPWKGVITCGHNPWVKARKVADLNVYTDEYGREKVSWQELPMPDFHDQPID